MTLGDEVDAELAYMRAEHESLMRDRCRIERAMSTVRDEDTLEDVAAMVTVYEGPCRLRQGGAQPTVDAVAGRVFATTDAVLRIPVGPERFLDNDTVTITHAHYDPSLWGRTFTVRGTDMVTTATSRRLRVSEVTAS